MSPQQVAGVWSRWVHNPPQGHIPAKAFDFAILPVFNPTQWSFAWKNFQHQHVARPFAVDRLLVALSRPSPGNGRQRAVAAQVVQRFARAGWLKRASTARSPLVLRAVPPAADPVPRVRVLQQTGPAAARRAGVRLVISGRINDVCAELDRLADQERQLSTRAA